MTRPDAGVTSLLRRRPASERRLDLLVQALQSRGEHGLRRVGRGQFPGGSRQLVQISLEARSRRCQHVRRVHRPARPHDRFQNSDRVPRRALVALADLVAESRRAEDLLRARQGGLAGRKLGGGAAVVGDELVGAVEVWPVGGHADLDA
jgi:hypothetical protein